MDLKISATNSVVFRKYLQKMFSLKRRLRHLKELRILGIFLEYFPSNNTVTDKSLFESRGHFIYLYDYDTKKAHGFATLIK